MARKIIPEKVEEAKERIISASLDLIIKEGFSRFTLSSVAEKVGITKASIYWYFPNKEELLNATASSMRIAFFESARQIAEKPISPAQKIEELIMSLENNEIHKRCFLLIKVFIEMYSIDHNIKKTIQDTYREYMEIIEGIFGEAIQKGRIKTNLDKITLTRLLLAMLDGCVIHDEMIGRADYKKVCACFISSFFKEGEIL